MPIMTGSLSRRLPTDTGFTSKGLSGRKWTAAENAVYAWDWARTALDNLLRRRNRGEDSAPLREAIEEGEQRLEAAAKQCAELGVAVETAASPVASREANIAAAKAIEAQIASIARHDPEQARVFKAELDTMKSKFGIVDPPVYAWSPPRRPPTTMETIDAKIRALQANRPATDEAFQAGMAEIESLMGKQRDEISAIQAETRAIEAAISPETRLAMMPRAEATPYITPQGVANPARVHALMAKFPAGRALLAKEEAEAEAVRQEDAARLRARQTVNAPGADPARVDVACQFLANSGYDVPGYVKNDYSGNHIASYAQSMGSLLPKPEPEPASDRAFVEKMTATAEAILARGLRR